MSVVRLRRGTGTRDQPASRLPLGISRPPLYRRRVLLGHSLLKEGCTRSSGGFIAVITKISLILVAQHARGMDGQCI